jgi:hypothetical protein
MQSNEVQLHALFSNTEDTEETDDDLFELELPSRKVQDRHRMEHRQHYLFVKSILQKV